MTVAIKKLISIEEAAKLVGLSVSGVWRSIADGRLPKPVYPSSRAPRLYEDEVYAALEKTRALPREAKERRRRAVLDRGAAT